MASKYAFILEPMILTSVIVVADLLIGLVLNASWSVGSFLWHASNLLIIEFGMLLIAGGCLMSRQPLQEKDRYDASGKPTASWETAMLGRLFLVCALFVLLSSLGFALASALW